jgi:glycosyltransferase involved in cell wall biosynthesis
MVVELNRQVNSGSQNAQAMARGEINLNPLLSIVIPCLNERETIAQAVIDAERYARECLTDDFEVIVADNGSTDGTLEILSLQAIARIVRVPVRGYGAALHWGILNAHGKYVLFADADLSYPFLNIPLYVEATKDEPDLTLGSRLAGTIEPGAMPFLNRYLGTPVLTALIRIFYKIDTTDCNSGMRMVKRSFYSTLNMRSSGMEWASELLLKTALKGGKYTEFPIQFKKDQRNRPPHLSRWADGWRHLKAIILLKPSITYPFLVLFPLLAAATYKISFAFTFFFLLLTVSLAMALAANRLLLATLDGQENWVSRFLKKFALVQTSLVVSAALIFALAFIPEEHLGTKLLLASLSNLVLIWLFLVETIKTHVSNRLPDATET